MGFSVVNTIHLPGVDFGEHLLAPVDAELISAMGRTEEELLDSTSGADAVVCSGPVQPWTERVINALQRCRIIASLGIGYDRIDLDAATLRGIVVTNVPDYCIDEVSTHAIALMLSLERQLSMLEQAVRSDFVNFVPPNRPSVETRLRPVRRLRDQTLGIVGLGRIGTATALKARGLGMRVVAYDPYVWDAVMATLGVTAVDFDTLLRLADVISLHCALTPETRDMFNRGTFERMQPGSFLINTARGEIIDEPALVDALQGGRLAGAGLDVTRNDPIPPEDPLLTSPNLILTGHSAWYSADADSATEFWQKAMTQVVSALKGRWPQYAVNPRAEALWMAKWGGGS